MAAELLFHTYRNLGEFLLLMNGGRTCLVKMLWPKKKRSYYCIKNLAASSATVVYGSWHELPLDIMEMIIQRLDGSSDHVRMSMVCMSWRSALVNNNKGAIRIRVPPPPLPWLLLPPKNWNNWQSLNFYDLTEGKTRTIDLPSKLFHGGQCCGASKGWLIMTSLDTEIIYLLNPLSGAHHQLPSLSTITSSSFSRGFFFFFPGTLDYADTTLEFVNRIELSSADLSECTVAAIFDGYRILAYCRPKDKSWTVFQGITISEEEDNINVYDQYENILFSNERLLFAIIRNKAKRVVVPSPPAAYNLVLGDDHQITLNILFLSDYLNLEMEEELDAPIINGFGILSDSVMMHYYIPHCKNNNNNNGGSSIELFIVRKYMDRFTTNGGAKDVRYLKTNRFEIFKLTSDDDQDSCSSSSSSFRVSKVESLKDGALFLTIGGSLFLSAETRNLNFLNQNCIYFADDDEQDADIPHYLSVSRELGVFSLDDGKIHRSFPSVQLPLLSRMAWFFPNPW